MAAVSFLKREYRDPLPACSPQRKIEENSSGISVSSTASSVHENNSGSSVSSTASSVHEIIVSETERKHDRINRMRLRRKLAKLGLQSNSNNPENSVQSPKGIMSVRTLHESLDGGKIADMRKLRRKMTIHVKSLDASYGSSVSTGESSVFDDMSSVSGLSVERTGKTSLYVKLGFTNVDIREYQLVPGSNPSVSNGPPVELGWAHTELTSVDLEQWERIRDGRRRLQAQMRIPSDVRKGLLVHHGNGQKAIRDATRNAVVARKQRIQTLEKMRRIGPLNGKVQKVKRALNVKRVFKKKKEEKQLYGT